LPSLTTREISYAALCTALIAGGALISIPVGPVPFTLQVFSVLLTGLVLGPRLGALSVTAYLLLGLVAPVYAGGTSGLGILFGPAGGYLWGFLPGVLLAGAVAGAGRSHGAYLVAGGLAGLVPIYALGAFWLATSLHTTSGAVVLVGGVLQFLPLDIVKAVAAGLAARSLLSLPLGLPAPQRGH
jgi:biotin transport system substrate-specific component